MKASVRRNAAHYTVFAFRPQRAAWFLIGCISRSNPILIFSCLLFRHLKLYFLLNGFRLNPIAAVDKIAELTLIVLLFVDGRQSSSHSVVEAATT
jgi:hypothetical protein